MMPASGSTRITCIGSAGCSCSATGSGSSQRTSPRSLSTLDLAAVRALNASRLPRTIAGLRMAFEPPIEEPAPDGAPSPASNTSPLGSVATTRGVTPHRRLNSPGVGSTSWAMMRFSTGLIAIALKSFPVSLHSPKTLDRRLANVNGICFYAFAEMWKSEKARPRCGQSKALRHVYVRISRQEAPFSLAGSTDFRFAHSTTFRDGSSRPPASARTPIHRWSR
jgi:hypothetical protein